MKTRTIVAALLALTQVSWMLMPVNAQDAEHGKPEKNRRQIERGPVVSGPVQMGGTRLVVDAMQDMMH